MLTTSRFCRSFISLPKRNFRAAVLLAGNGVYDGTECTEAVSLLVALGKHKAQVQCFAPDRDQHHVVNHMTGEEQQETRNVLLESARIARGQVQAIDKLKAQDFDVLFVPGGFGAAKNLSDFGIKGAEMSVKEDVKNVLLDFHKSQKYIGLCCISPVVAAKVFGTKSGGPGLKMTLGGRGDSWPYNGSIDAASSFGNNLVESDLADICHDKQNKIVTAAAYMKGTAQPDEIFSNVGLMVNEVAKELNQTKAPISLVVNVEIHEDRIQDFLKAITIDAVGSRLEPGCHRFDVLRDQENPNKFTFYEVYESPEAVEFHRATPHFKVWSDFKATGGVKSQSVSKSDAIDFTY